MSSYSSPSSALSDCIPDSHQPLIPNSQPPYSHHQHPNLLRPLQNILIKLSILPRIGGITEALAAKRVFDLVKPGSVDTS